MNDQQRVLLLFINERIRTTGVSPTMHEMAKAIGNKHRSGAHRYLGLLEAEGWIRRTAKRKQSIEVLRLPGETVLNDPAREDVISRLADELARRTAAVQDAHCVTKVFASWILDTIERSGFRLIASAGHPVPPSPPE